MILPHKVFDGPLHTRSITPILNFFIVQKMDVFRNPETNADAITEGLKESRMVDRIANSDKCKYLIIAVLSAQSLGVSVRSKVTPP